MIRDGDGWRRSSKCDNSGPNCVEVLKVIDCIYVRDSKDEDHSVVLVFTEPEWKAFIEGVKDDEFDLPDDDDDDDEVDSEDEEDDESELDAAVR